MADSSFGRGWPSCDGRRVTVRRRDGLAFVIHAELADLVTMLIDLTELRGYDVKPGQTWGYACRAIAGTDDPSNHSWATAIDVNSLANPRLRRGQPMRSDLPRAIVGMWKAHGFRWGGDFSWPDPMHFEFMGNVRQARAITLRLRAFLAAGGHPAPNPPTRPGLPAYPGAVRRGSRGRPVRVWQQMLKRRGYRLAVDGVFGPVTERALRDWQSDHHPHAGPVDGVGGPATWHSLLFA